ncbi:basal-body rod modification protein flgD [Collimonas arenae]|uniref:Basal-body rod modification protein FlgD n=1 Tax=Collimonas arenae TaxID=279058 RepID=A0A127PML4_9BURK|nr:flagellar hook assembly protein FlgD [Collimonas arenae]AMO98834.1 basal-body rod modification protein flgD [Collimonas arenae]AMP08731.1 basal-body rod modification protein flgD [Collimonas arenae]
MAVSGVSSTDNSAANALAGAASSSSDQEQRFLKLLVTQLNNQDPLNPMDNAQLTSQLAQMSTVSGIENLNSTLTSLVAQTGASQTLQAASLIGHTVLTPGSSVTAKSGTNTSFGLDMQGAADTVKVTITDSAGNTVRTIDVGALPQGTKTLTWDGKNDTGSAMPDGAYKISVAASVNGGAVAANTLTYSQVASVAQTANGVTLNLGAAGTAALSDVKQFL